MSLVWGRPSLRCPCQESNLDDELRRLASGIHQNKGASLRAMASLLRVERRQPSSMPGARVPPRQGEAAIRIRGTLEPGGASRRVPVPRTRERVV